MPSGWSACCGSLAASRGRQPDRAEAAGRHRRGPGASADRRHRRPRPGRRLQRQHRPRRRATSARQLEAEGKTVKILAVGRKGRDYLRRELASRIVGDISYAGKQAHRLRRRRRRSRTRVTAMLEAGEFDVCTLIYNRFQSVISQIVDRAAADPGAAAGTAARARTPARALPTSSSRTRRPSWRGCCRRTWRSRSTARCWKAPPASTARG